MFDEQLCLVACISMLALLIVKSKFRFGCLVFERLLCISVACIFVSLSGAKGARELKLSISCY